VTTLIRELPRSHAEIAPAAAGPRRFRPDIQGLRAVAVLLVVLYHAHVPGIRGGYVGVDVFFVISGFLITGQLVREVQSRGRIHFADFYLKRIRRLLPPVILVVVATLLAARYWAPPLQTKSLGTDAIFSSFYALNFRLAAEGIDYQQSTAPPSPLQHLWSLAVEEQFYIVWPMLIMLIVVLTRRWWRITLPVVLVAGTAWSLYESQQILVTNAPLSYFSLQSRAWELGIGGLLALSATSLARVPRQLATVCSWTGLAAVVGAALYFTDSTSFPGYNALIPVLAAALVIAAGCLAEPVGAEKAVLAARPMQGLGKVSYAWYLWHWPLIILAPMVTSRYQFGWLRNCEMMVLALWLAILTFYVIETPSVRGRLVRSRWLAIGLIAPTMLAGCAVVVGKSAIASLQPGDSVVRYSTSGDPFIGATRSGAVTPGVVAASSDSPRYPHQCISDFAVTTPAVCYMTAAGNEPAKVRTTQRVVLLGDSHAGQWFDAIRAIAESRGWGVEVLNKAGCPISDLVIVNPTLKRTYTECTAWRNAALDRLAHEPPPQMIFVGELAKYGVENHVLQAGWRSTISRLRVLDVPIVDLRDTPHPTEDVPTCLSGSLNNWSRCDFARAKAFVSGTSPAPSLFSGVVDINQYLCPTSYAAGLSCPAVRGSTLLYRDNSHVTRTAMTALTAVIRAQLVAAGLLNRT
jgi:peptidoglycan/LPS O-acetylase OafA/YrhL